MRMKRGRSWPNGKHRIRLETKMMELWKQFLDLLNSPGVHIFLLTGLFLTLLPCVMFRDPTHPSTSKMKTLITLMLLTSAAMAGQTRTEADLKRQLEAAQTALSVYERSRAVALAVGTDKLSAAVAVTVENSQRNTQKIEAVAEQVSQSVESGKRLVEVVTTQANATRNETQNLANVVKGEASNITNQLAAQAKQQKDALLAAQQTAKNLEETNAKLKLEREADRVDKEKTQAVLSKIEIATALAAARDEAGASARRDRNKLINDVLVPFIPVLLAIVVYFQMKASAQAKVAQEIAKETHIMVNGKQEAKDARIKILEDKVRSLGGSTDETIRT